MTIPQHLNRRAFALSLGASLVLAGGAPAHAQSPLLASAPNPIKVGVRGGVDEQIWEVVTAVAKQHGLHVRPIVFAAAISPNEALNNGDLDANSFQHVPFLRDQVQQRGYKIVAVGNTLLSPIAFYSKKYKSLEALPNGAELAIPGDPSNQTRALVILRDHGLITLREGFDPYTGTAVLADITANPRHLKLREVTGGAVLARSLQDVDAAAIINSFASQVGLLATRDGIAIESRERNPYVNVIAVREQDREQPWVQPLLQAYHSEQVRQFIETTFQGSVIPAF